MSGESPLVRFERSMVMDFDKWHDGIGYEVELIREMSAAEKHALEAKLLAGGRDWRDVQALAVLGTPAALDALRKAMKSSDPEVRNAVLRFAPDLVSGDERTASLVHALGSATIFGGLTQTLSQVETFHPPEVIDALLRGALERDGEQAVHFAAMLMFVHGKAKTSFDWGKRPFFLRFHTENRAERETVFRELCGKIGVDAAKYVTSTG